MECGIIKKIREAEGGRAGGYGTAVSEQLEGGELAGSHRGGNDTQKKHNQICVITVMKQRRKEKHRKITIKEVFDMPQPSRSLCLNIPSISTTKPLQHNTLRASQYSTGMYDFTSPIHAGDRQLVDSS